MMTEVGRNAYVENNKLCKWLVNKTVIYTLLGMKYIKFKVIKLQETRWQQCSCNHVEYDATQRKKRVPDYKPASLDL
jgi:hypothetical protein